MNPVVEDAIAELTLEDDEDRELQIESVDQPERISFANYFVGRFLTTSVINFQAMRNTLANLWRPLGGISILDIGNNRFLFRLFHSIDLDRIEEGGPWNFNSHLLILHRLKAEEDPHKVPLDVVNFWILVHDVPHGYISENVSRQLGNFIGKFIEYDYRAVSLGYKGIMRLRAYLDTRKPLKRQKKLRLQGGESHTVRFEYEKLPLFCFICGKLGHGETHCPIRLTMAKEDIIFNWDISLRAPTRRSTGRQTNWWIREEDVYSHTSRDMEVRFKGSKINSFNIASFQGNIGGKGKGESNSANYALLGGNSVGNRDTSLYIEDSNISSKFKEGVANFRDVTMVSFEENNQEVILEGIKRPRVMKLALEVSNMDSTEASNIISAGHHNGASRSQ